MFTKQDYFFELDAVQEFPISWGLDRIDDEEGKPFDGKYEYKYTGYGVDVYILDSGIYKEHSEFSVAENASGRVPRSIKCGYDAFVIPNDNGDSFHDQCTDNTGHGTHVSAIIGGQQFGVSKDANLISVKVHDSVLRGASLSTILAGLDFVFREKTSNPTKPMVTLLALSGPISDVIQSAVESVVDVGVVVVVSAGNNGESSCTKSPASSAKVITVSATNFQDAKTIYAGDGPCTTLHAPGHQITSAWIRYITDAVRLSGTSMAAAHVAGGTVNYRRNGPLFAYRVCSHSMCSHSICFMLENAAAAQYLEKFPHWNPHEVATALTVHAIREAVTGETANNLTPNLLLNMRDLNDAVY